MLCALDLHAVPTAREAHIWPFSTDIKYLRHFAPLTTSPGGLLHLDYAMTKRVKIFHIRQPCLFPLPPCPRVSVAKKPPCPLLPPCPVWQKTLVSLVPWWQKKPLVPSVIRTHPRPTLKSVASSSPALRGRQASREGRRDARIR
jgi:hypothetical protein